VIEILELSDKFYVSLWCIELVEIASIKLGMTILATDKELRHSARNLVMRTL